MTLIVILSAGIGLLLGLLGGGGSILTLPLLVYLVHMEPKAAIATSLLVVGTTSAVAMIGRALRGSVCWKTGLSFGLASMLGAYAGGRLAEFVPSSVLLLGFAMLMFGTAFAMLSSSRRTPESELGGPLCPAHLPLLAIAFDGILVGCLTGLVGAGGGFLIVPALALLGGLPMQSAVGTSLMVLALQSFAALAGHIQHVSIDLDLAGIIVGGTVGGSLLGALIARFVNGTALRRLFGLLVIGVASYLVYREASTDLLHEIRNQLGAELMTQAGTRLFWVWVADGILAVLGILSLGVWLHTPARPAARPRSMHYPSDLNRGGSSLRSALE
ncbi:sulfite exporter TauE/SafE family protein [Methylotetracoccus oryzae]|uniref:sulfite exporter TauE/SafE family protein n=1 Tax=Methylotetracoccus oryzae TaxID=1919059 RepID=UPI00111B36EF|nr:sulfite exporter TauE/SafE family protein [Methylotetracoccus oryzae]